MSFAFGKRKEMEVIKLFRRFRARTTTNRAFFLVEEGDMEGALALLRRAVQIDPTYGHAHNEMAYVLGKKLRRLDEAEDAARRAIECDPQNPKFHNALMGLLIDRVSSLNSQKKVRTAVAERITELDRAIAEDPAYPPYHLGKAAALASSGHPRTEWQAEIQKARDLYAGRTYAASGLRLGPGDVEAILARNTHECEELGKRWDLLPED